jgi:hypothetical protein
VRPGIRQGTTTYRSDGSRSVVLAATGVSVIANGYGGRCASRYVEGGDAQLFWSVTADQCSHRQQVAAGFLPQRCRATRRT